MRLTVDQLVELKVTQLLQEGDARGLKPISFRLAAGHAERLTNLSNVLGITKTDFITAAVIDSLDRVYEKYGFEFESTPMTEEQLQEMLDRRQDLENDTTAKEVKLNV